MPLGYIIPGVKKYIHQGSTVQDTIPTPGTQKINAQLQHYENVAQAQRYITKVKVDLHSGPPKLDIFIPKLPTTPYPVVTYPIPRTKFIDQPVIVASQDVFEPKQNYPYPVTYLTKPVYDYIDVGPLVQSSQHVFGFKSNPYPYQLVTYPIPRQSQFIDVGPRIQQDQHVYGFRSGPAYPILYPVQSGSKFIQVDIASVPDIFVRKFYPYPTIPYQIPPLSKHIQVPPYTNQQTYIFPLPKPIQEWYQRAEYFRYVRKIKPILDNITAITTGNALLACIDTAISWSNHFASHGWTDVQDQLTAGYPIFIEPALTTGSYQEVFDFGSIISNIIAIVTWNQVNVTGSVTTASTTLETSTDGITWSAPTVGTSVFAPSLRYVRLTMNFVGADDKSLAIYSNLQCLLNVHREQDGGQANVFAADAGGTVVTFNKAFKALDALTVTPISTVEQKAVYDFAFPPNPTTFKVLLFNAAGARIDGLITWVARGIF